MKPWSKLQKQIYLLLDVNINLQIHCNAYRMQSQRGSTSLPRYWITLDKEIIFDYPKNFLESKLPREGKREKRPNTFESWLFQSEHTVQELYPYYTEIQDISCLFREYIDTPVQELFDKQYKNDAWGLTDLLKAADKRIGKDKLLKLRESTNNPNVIKILDARGVLS